MLVPAQRLLVLAQRLPVLAQRLTPRRRSQCEGKIGRIETLLQERFLPDQKKLFITLFQKLAIVLSNALASQRLPVCACSTAACLLNG